MEAGGCARNGQGSNGAMWLVVWRDGQPQVIASPGADFNGWLYDIQPQSHHGFHDIVLGWHMGYAEIDLTYFTFDGTRYKAVSYATLQNDDAGGGKIVPHPKRAK